MRKLGVLFLLFACVITLCAQHESVSFLNEKGGMRSLSSELAKDTLINKSHRMDDIVWSRVVYRIVDMRYKQNFPLYYPETATPGDEYRSLFKLMLDALVDGMPVYRKTLNEIKPTLTVPLKKKEVAEALVAGDVLSETMDFDLELSDNYLLNYSEETDSLRLNHFAYEPYVRNQIKWVIQEVIYFDKHTSRLDRKILAIAPLYSYYIDEKAYQTKPMEFLQKSLLFWIAFDEFRPYMSAQVVKSEKNTHRLVTYDNFFAQHQYFSYLLGDTDLFNRTLLEGGGLEPEHLRKEQERIETELLNFEQDLWEY